MRMWMIEPKLICRKHLLGEHLELHMLLDNLKKGKKLKGFIDKRIIEPKSIYARHEAIKNEMLYRGYKHKSNIGYLDFYISLNQYSLIYYGRYLNVFTVDRNKSLIDLTFRCKECSTRIIGKYYGKKKSWV